MRTMLFILMVLMSAGAVGAQQQQNSSVQERVDAIVAEIRAGNHVGSGRYADIEDAVLPRLFDLISDTGLKDDQVGNIRRRAWQVIFSCKKDNLENTVRVFEIFEAKKFPVVPDMLMQLERYGKDPRVHSIMMKAVRNPEYTDIVRGNAINVVAQLPDAAAEAVMLEILALPYSYGMSYPILHALREMGAFTSEAAEKACIRYLGHQDKYCAEAAYGSLVKMLKAQDARHAAGFLCAKNMLLRNAAIDSLAGGPDPVASLKYLKAALKRQCSAGSRKKISAAITACRAGAQSTMLLSKFKKSGLSAELDALAANIDPASLMRPDEAKTAQVEASFDKIQGKYGADTYMCLLVTPFNMEDKAAWGRMALLNVVMERRHPPYSVLKEVVAGKGYLVDSKRMAVAMLPVSDGLNRPEAVKMLEGLLRAKGNGGLERGEIKMALGQLRSDKVPGAAKGQSAE